nr:cupin-like domain-containing protein [Sphingorhabdus lutea]
MTKIEHQVFDDEARHIFEQNYPEIPHKIKHQLEGHKLLTLDALALLGDALPPQFVEYNKGDLPIGVDPDNVPKNGMSIGDTIRNIDVAKSWAVLKNIEQNPQYEKLLLDLLAEIKPTIEDKTGAMLRPQGFIFVSSPNAVTPYHFDPEHNILMQLRGHKSMTQFPAGDVRFAPPSSHENYHSGGPRNLIWSDDFLDSGTQYTLYPGDALFVPVMAPHFVKNGSEPSISLSITWRSNWSFDEAYAHGFNGMMRKWGMSPNPPKRYPGQNKFKSIAYRAINKILPQG